MFLKDFFLHCVKSRHCVVKGKMVWINNLKMNFNLLKVILTKFSETKNFQNFIVVKFHDCGNNFTIVPIHDVSHLSEKKNHKV